MSAVVETRTRTLVSFRTDVVLSADDGALVVEHPWGTFRLRGLSSVSVEALLALSAGPVDPAVLAELPQMATLLPKLRPLLCRTVARGTRPLATAVPMTPDAVYLETPPPEAGDEVALSDFAYVHRIRGDGDALLESPLSSYRIVLHDGAAAALAGALACPAPVGEAAASAGMTLEAARAFVGLLVAAGMAVAEPETDPALELWSFHDLLFHARSRLGRHDHPFGGLYRHAETRPPLPAVARARAGTLIELPRPEWDEIAARDATLTEALESRRSIRDYDADAPVTLAQLGELLYRAARVRGVVPADPENGLPYDAVDRPFPTGGGSGELELYLTVARADGVEPGVYHYDAGAHGLRPIAASEQDRRELLAAAWRAAAGRVDPQVLLTITARFGRVSWKYESIAYALTLKHVGVLYQTLYLVATAMGLAPCGLGSGNADVAARAFGLDWATESSVGEFLIGSRAPGQDLPAKGFRAV